MLLKNTFQIIWDLFEGAYDEAEIDDIERITGVFQSRNTRNITCFMNKPNLNPRCLVHDAIPDWGTEIGKTSNWYCPYSGEIVEAL